MNLFNLMLCVLFKVYRRNNDAFVAAFHAKSILTVVLCFNAFNLHIVTTRIFKWFTIALPFPPTKIVLGLFLAFPLWILVHLISSTHQTLEKYELNDNEYRRGWFIFILFAGIGIISFFFLAINFKIPRT